MSTTVYVIGIILLYILLGSITVGLIGLVKRDEGQFLDTMDELEVLTVMVFWPAVFLAFIGIGVVRALIWCFIEVYNFVLGRY